VRNIALQASVLRGVAPIERGHVTGKLLEFLAQPMRRVRRRNGDCPLLARRDWDSPLLASTVATWQKLPTLRQFRIEGFDALPDSR
jgi:hypothetical protein